MAHNIVTIHQYEEKTEYIKIHAMSGTNALTDQHIRHAYYLIYLTLHWPFLINLRLCSLSINSYEYSCHTIWDGLFNALFIWLINGKVAQWLKFRAVNHDIMGSNPAETVYLYIFLFSRILIKSSFCRFFLHISHVFTWRVQDFLLFYFYFE